jgi:hypothetical protein|tara:strand:- start:808 stop:1323 length:516 start_codon:yes stop_codon:yes gene_type:complete
VGESIKSIFKPSHPEKYQGNPNNIICRSSWERRFCHWCDVNPNILKWASEEFSIPYVCPTDGRLHRYYPDFLIEVRDVTGKVKKQLIEVKPKRQTQKPPTPKKITKSFLYEAAMYEKNQAKWRAATEFCLDNGVEFRIITEDELGIKQYDSRRTRSNGVQRRRKPNRRSRK